VTNFTVELQFTETYRRYQHEHPAIREAMCLRAQYPGVFRPIQESDLLAGRVAYAAVGFSPQEGGIGLGYYCAPDRLKQALASGELTPLEQAQVQEMLGFWSRESTAAKVRAAFPAHLQEWLPTDDWQNQPGIAYPLYRVTGGYLDFDKLVQLGLPGLKAEIAEARARTVSPDAGPLYDGMLMALDLVSEVCTWYGAQAVDLAGQTAEPRRRRELEGMAEALHNIAHRKPANFREAAQLAWLYVLTAGHRNYGRLDVYLGDFYVRDLATGRITEAEALAVLQSLWRLMSARKIMFDGRVFLGGKGRRNEADADQVAVLAMEATRTVLENEPQLSLRFYKGQDPKLMQKALAVLGEGRTFPILYNDDVNVPAVMKAFGVPCAEAEEYLPFSCGEYVLNHRSYGSPNGVINLLKALEATLHGGSDGLAGTRIGLDSGSLSEFATFDDLFAAYKRQVDFFVGLMADHETLEYRVAGEEAPFLLTAMLYDDCISRGKGLFSGGIRYLGGTLETYGNTNTADSLMAIKQLVFERQAITLPELVDALDANFDGHALLRKQLQNASKYGNDDDTADAMAVAVHEHVCNSIREQAPRVGLDTYLAVLINNSANTVLGLLTAASPDGRMAREPMANANNPAGGADKKGVTAFLNSLVKLDPSIHAGAVQNMKFSRELFTTRRAELEALLETYWGNGGTQAMITVVSRGDLEAALKEPEKYYHIFVRVGGFTARFVRMDPDVQREVLSRTLY
jgi:pyruvate-formate lyase